MGIWITDIQKPEPLVSVLKVSHTIQAISHSIYDLIMDFNSAIQVMAWFNEPFNGLTTFNHFNTRLVVFLRHCQGKKIIAVPNVCSSCGISDTSPAWILKIKLTIIRKIYITSDKLLAGIGS